jgi:hypothetical protein
MQMADDASGLSQPQIWPYLYIKNTPTLQTYEKLCTKLKDLSALQGINGLLGWDEVRWAACPCVAMRRLPMHCHAALPLPLPLTPCHRARMHVLLPADGDDAERRRW